MWEEAYREQHQTQNDERRIARTDSGNQNVETRRMAFMTEKEKKEELILRQRAELAIKKGTAELDESTEKEIGKEVLSSLEVELTKLLVEEMEEKVHSNLPILRKNNQTGDNTKQSVEAKSDSKMLKRPSILTKDKKDSVVKSNGDASIVNIEDLFDLEKLDNPTYSPIGIEDQPSHGDEEENTNIRNHGSNEFAAELLYIMRSSMSLS